MKSMTYTSPPLARDVYVAGIPVVRVMLSSENAKDADVHAYLNAVCEDGTSRLISEGMLRASHRTLGRAPYRNFDLPFPSSSSKDIASVTPLSLTPVPLELTMVAVGRVFKKGERIRLTLAGADRGNTLAVEQSPVPKLTVQVGGGDPSWLRLPILGDRKQALFE